MTSKKLSGTEEDRRKKKEEEELESLKYLRTINNSKILWLSLIVLFLLYLVFKSVILAAAAAIVFALIIVLEVWIGIKTGGLMNEIKETVLAIFLALLIWYGSGFLLNTDSPLDAVVSCSMNPALDRGDMLVLEGGEVNAPIAYLTQEEWDEVRYNLLDRQCAVCRTLNYDEACLVDRGGKVVAPSDLFNYECKLCERIDREGRKIYVPCTTSVIVKNETYRLSTERDTIIYVPQAGDPFAASGQIVHRAQIILAVGSDKYILAKGDNNNWFDVQIGNSPIVMDRVKGRVILRAPYIGYFKLFISGLFQEPPACGEVFTGTQAIKIDR